MHTNPESHARLMLKSGLAFGGVSDTHYSTTREACKAAYLASAGGKYVLVQVFSEGRGSFIDEAEAIALHKEWSSLPQSIG
jgi:hypothetical protein